MVRYLTGEAGADVNQATGDVATPIFVAAQEGHPEVVRYLAGEAGADINQATANGATPIYMACLWATSNASDA